jgi:Yos1-like
MFAILLTGLYAMIFALNAVCILNDSRFLNKLGIREMREPGLWKKVAEMIKAAKTLCTIPLIVLNSVCILYELILG